MRSLLRGILFAMIVSNAMTQTIQNLRTEVESDFKSVDGLFALAMKDLKSGQTLLVNEHVAFHAASTMKTPVMIEVFKQANEGRFSLQDRVRVKNEFRSIVDSSVYHLDLKDDSDDSLYSKVGSEISIEDLVKQMITVSSNLATNILIELVGAQKVNATAHRLGARNMQVLRGVEDLKAFERGMNNTTTALDLLVVFEAMVNGSVVDRKSCDKMLDILSHQEFRDKIPALLPPGTRVAHKTGNITGVEHDSGVVFLPDGTAYVLVILSKDLKDAKAAKSVIARVSRKVYDFIVSNR
jgi:beta-lactamase class A